MILGYTVMFCKKKSKKVSISPFIGFSRDMHQMKRAQTGAEQYKEAVEIHSIFTEIQQIGIQSGNNA